MATIQPSIKIAGLKIGPGEPVFTIAEMSGNHNQSLPRALKIVDAAAKAGARALKLQTYTADTMTLNTNQREFFLADPKSLWKGQSLYELYSKAYTPWEWHQPIFDRCREHGMIAFSTPFDDTAVDFLERLNVPCYKVASFENTDLPLIEKIAATGKPIILSTGMATVEELGETVLAARNAGCKDLVLLKCISAYPANPADANLRTLPHMKDLFCCEVGISDHTLGIGAAVASIALGATVVEKHFTLQRADGGVDAAFSMEPDEFNHLVMELESAQKSLGEIFYGPTDSEKESLTFRRSIYVTRDLKEGEQLTRENIRIIRPGLGLPPKYYPAVLGKKVSKAVKLGTPLNWELLE